MILKIFPCPPFATNTVLLACEDTKKAVVIDPGLNSYKNIIDEIKREHLDVQAILLTHSHWDHIAGVSEWKKHLDIPVWMHEEDKDNLINPGSDGLYSMLTIEGVEPDYFLSDGEVIMLGNITIEVIYTPGHSVGSVCFYLPKEKILFSGDTLFKGSIGKISFPTSEPKKMWDSLKKIEKLPKDTEIIPGHGKKTILSDEDWLKNAREMFS